MRWVLDVERSVLEIAASSSIHPIHTRTRVAGWIELDSEGWLVEPPVDQPLGEISFDITTMRSGNPLIDRESERRLQPRRYPTVTGVLTSLTPRADGTLDGVGDLTFHGVTREIRGPLRTALVDGEVELSGTASIDVTDFGVQPPSLLVVKVHKVVTVTLEAVATTG